MLGKSFSACLITASLLSIQVSAFWRLPCPQTLFVGRSDPIDTPGQIAHHVHTIHGGNRFQKSCTNEDLKASTCSSCMVKQDKSAYWTPNLFFKRQSDGKYLGVKTKSGILVYYLQRGENVRAFPDDFRVIAGDSRLRNFTWPSVAKSDYHQMGLDRNQDFLRQKSSGFNCLNYDEPANPTLGNNELPKDWKNCKDGIRGEVNLPSCWNGKDVDSDDHHSHMAYPSLADDGVCPPTHPHRLVTILIEVIFDIAPFLDQEGYFVLSNGDATGYSFHADFQNAWDKDVLQNAIDNCRDDSGLIDKCGEFDLYTEEEYMQCTLPNEFPENVWGPLAQIPGCNPLSSGPEYAPTYGSECGGEGDEESENNSPTSNTPKYVDVEKPVNLKPLQVTPTYGSKLVPVDVPASKPVVDSNPSATPSTDEEPCVDANGPDDKGITQTVEKQKDASGNDVDVVVLTHTVTHYTTNPDSSPPYQPRNVNRKL